MTDTTNALSNIPTTPEYQFAYVLATIHSTFLLGDMDRVYALLSNLPTALSDPKVNEIYLSDEVTQYLEWAYPHLFGEEDEAPAADEYETHPDMTEEEAEEFLAALWERLFGTDPDAFKAPELVDGCDDETCGCHDVEEDNEELIAETDEFIIVKIWK